MAMVVRITSIITQESHRVTISNVFWVVLHEFLGAVPKSRDGFHILVQAQDETVLLLIFGHEFERIIIDVAEQLNTWLDSPVPFIFQHQFLSEEEPRFKSAHVSITDGVAIDDLLLCHLLPNLACLFLVNVWWERPVLFWNLPIVGFSRYQGGCDLFECIIERLVI